MDGPTSVAPVGASTTLPPPAGAEELKYHRTAQQFEAMFMGEMLRMAHPTSKATGAFAAGAGEKAWQGFMDQALGEAVAAKGHTGLTKVIEKAMKAAAHQTKGAGR